VASQKRTIMTKYHPNYLDYSYVFIRVVDIKIVDKATE
jgi:hypothetical protein